MADNLEDASNELILADEEEVRYLIGEVFSHVPVDEVLDWLHPPVSGIDICKSLYFQVHQKACNDLCEAQVCSCVCLLINLPGGNEWNFVLTKIPTPAQNWSPNYRSFLILPEQKFNYLLHRLVTTSCAFSNLHLSWSKNKLPWR